MPFNATSILPDFVLSCRACRSVELLASCALWYTQVKAVSQRTRYRTISQAELQAANYKLLIGEIFVLELIGKLWK